MALQVFKDTQTIPVHMEVSQGPKTEHYNINQGWQMIEKNIRYLDPMTLIINHHWFNLTAFLSYQFYDSLWNADVGTPSWLSWCRYVASVLRSSSIILHRRAVTPASLPLASLDNCERYLQWYGMSRAKVQRDCLRNMRRVTWFFGVLSFILIYSNIYCMYTIYVTIDYI